MLHFLEGAKRLETALYAWTQHAKYLNIFPCTADGGIIFLACIDSCPPRLFHIWKHFLVLVFLPWRFLCVFLLLLFRTNLNLMFIKSLHDIKDLQNQLPNEKLTCYLGLRMWNCPLETLTFGGHPRTGPPASLFRLALSVICSCLRCYYCWKTLVLRFISILLLKTCSFESI